MRRRVTKAIDSDHDQPIFPNLAKVASIDGPDRNYPPPCAGWISLIPS
jgi:hypothetical protein